MPLTGGAQWVMIPPIVQYSQLSMAVQCLPALRQHRGSDDMSEAESDKRHPSWHPLPASSKYHAHVMGLHDQAHADVIQRNKTHEDILAEMRNKRAEPPLAD